MARISIDDLEFGATWLEAYEGSEEHGEDENVERARRLAGWLRAEAARREESAAVRDIMSRTGASRDRARAAYRRALAERDAG